MLRVTSGSAKNKKLILPEIPNIRAVQDVVKLSLFSILGDKIQNAVCADIYAGSGNLGIEALSRGAQWCDFVDANYLSKVAVIENLKNCGFTEKSDFFLKDAVKFVTKTQKKYDVVFVDPFYEVTTHKYLVKNLRNILKSGGNAVFFHGDNLDMDTLVKDTDLKVVTHRKFGASNFTIFS